ncbi:hypothetical protein RIF29_19339 [Crotalaria pallida]|uniref:Remorin C-terminal domain-containing protein n=1 Tax=Crotalaria pallida TaxID=3830 RepID=A0AAN9F137_CROPI
MTSTKTRTSSKPSVNIFSLISLFPFGSLVFVLDHAILVHYLRLDPSIKAYLRPRRWWYAHRSSSISMASTEGGASSENFTSMSREFSALVLAGSSIDHNNMSPMINYGHHYESEGNHGVNNNNNSNNNNNNLGRIGEEELMEETNPLAIVTDNHPFEQVQSSSSSSMRPSGGGSGQSGEEVLSVQRAKKEEVDAKIAAWQNAKIAKINKSFKREDVVINGWEGEQVQKATSWMKKIEDDRVVAFQDINPSSFRHYLVIPVEHIPTVKDLHAKPEHYSLGK